MNNLLKLNKKILIVSSWAPPSIGGPQNLYNLFCQFPKESYYILTSFYAINEVSAETGTWLPGKYFFYDNPGATHSKDKKSHFETKKLEVHWRKKLLYFIEKFNFIKFILQPLFIFLSVLKVISQGLKIIKEKKINIIVGVSDYGPALISTYFLYKFSKKPFCLFLFDLYSGNNFGHFYNLLARIFEPRLFKHAQKIILTNEGTRQFYIKRYGSKTSYEVIYNSVFPEYYLSYQKPYQPKEPYKIVFTGRIYWAQLRSLKNLIQAIDEIGNLKIRFIIYTPHSKEYIKVLSLNNQKVELNSASPNQMPSIQSQADILFLPLSWYTKSPAIISTATPGKLSDYLISGRPILIHAPSSTHLAQYAKENNSALVVDNENIEKLKEGICKLLLDIDYSRQLILNAQKTFYKNHDAKANAKKLTQIIENI